LYVRRLLDGGDPPDLIAIEVLPPLLAGQMPATHEHNFLEPERLMPAEVDTVLAHGFPREPTTSRRRTAQLVPWYGLRFPLLGRYGVSWLAWNRRCNYSRGPDPTGWIPSIHESVTPDLYRAGVCQAKREYYDL